MAPATAKEKFEKEKEKILKELPDTVKSMFGVMGFCKAEVEDDSDDDDDEPKKLAPSVEADYVPVLIVSPYDVPPRPVRDVYWFDMFSKFKRSKKLAEIEYLVYHYGSEDPLDCYSFIPQDEFKTYDNGLAEGFDKLPAAIQSKLDTGVPLTEEEEQRVRGLEEMREDALKPAEERKRGNWQFKERHEEEKAPPAKRQKTK